MSEPTAAAPVIDTKQFGRDLLALRIRRDLKPADRLTDLLREQYGVSVHPRTIYAIERGEQLPRLDLLLALLVALDARLDYFYPAFRDDIVARLTGSG